MEVWVEVSGEFMAALQARGISLSRWIEMRSPKDMRLWAKEDADSMVDDRERCPYCGSDQLEFGKGKVTAACNRCGKWSATHNGVVVDSNFNPETEPLWQFKLKPEAWDARQRMYSIDAARIATMEARERLNK